ncbi:non-ribosomal peptide synthetase [Pseudoalteromonas piscicida]|uniref:Non-ribosomal peptide synthetase n=1 Tax=Pseudoalteromonas piscicida TaxID=43662 RepID=A0AAD0RLA4_PSEO7|nr:non-ribosomal peptide synthetase [Pseudoalteromonas piscicida]ASD68759.1 hypothetical protein B1L02_18185 [Pseudoalteromonas piscicida]AXR03820.1 non-ribosomal peptide synthetase [Pseudoalteromonas piscicida]
MIENLLQRVKEQGIKLYLDNEGALKLRRKTNATNDQLIAEIKEKKAQIIDWLKVSAKANDKIARAEHIDNEAPASFAQQRMWLVNQLESSDAHYNMTDALHINGTIDLSVIEQTCYEIIKRHEPLRTVFFERDGQVWQKVLDEFHFQVTRFDFTQESENVDNLVSECVKQFSLQAFSLESDLMLKVGYIELPRNNTGEAQGVLLFNLHHIAGDGWSRGLLLKEFNHLYQSIQQGEPSRLIPNALRYLDYSVWQRGLFESSTVDSQRAYWLKQLNELPDVHALPLDHPRPPVQSFDGSRVQFALEAQLSTQLKALAVEQNVTLFMLLHAAFSLLLSRYSDCTDIVIGTPVANRRQQELEGLIGCFVNTLVLRTNTSENGRFIDYLHDVKKVNVNAQANQDMPFDLLVDELNPQRSPAYSPLFQIQFSMNNTESVKPNLASSSVSSANVSRSLVKYELALHAVEDRDGLNFRFEYNTSIFKQDTIQQLQACFVQLLKSIVATPQQGIHELTLVSESNQHHLLVELNDTSAPIAHDDNVVAAFTQQVADNPQRIAVTYEGESLTYQQLDERVNQLANHLQDNGVGAHSYVALYMERSLEMVVAIWAILKSGGAYIPIDPTLPAARVRVILQDASPVLVLTQKRFYGSLPSYHHNVVSLDEDSVIQTLSSCSESFETNSLFQQGQEAYIIYTSGSTGEPKGVICEHKGLFNRIDWMQKMYQLNSADCVLQKTPYSFDVSVWEFIWPLITGCRLVVAKPEGHKEPSYLSSLIQSQEVTTLHFVPSMLNLMLQAGDWEQCSTVRQVFCSGEALSSELQAQFFATETKSKLHNLYGPTEASIDVTYWECDSAANKGASVPIGRPIQNTSLVVLDKNGKLVPYGAVGELHIGGMGLAVGYLNKPELTKDKFIPNPFPQLNGPRLYKTGDLVRYSEGGKLEYLGRIDHQVKLHGLRIELGEIEYQLAQHDKVNQCLVMVREDIVNQPRLVAYFDSPHPDIETQCTEYLKQQLPSYMVPEVLIKVTQWPLTANGKIDRKKLPVPNVPDTLKYLAPENEIESQLQLFVMSILHLNEDQVSANADFFELGGNSLLAIKLISKINEQWQINISSKEIFNTRTIRGLGAEIEKYTLVLASQIITNNTQVEESGWL